MRLELKASKARGYITRLVAKPSYKGRLFPNGDETRVSSTFLSESHGALLYAHEHILQ